MRSPHRAAGSHVQALAGVACNGLHAHTLVTHAIRREVTEICKHAMLALRSTWDMHEPCGAPCPKRVTCAVFGAVAVALLHLRLWSSSGSVLLVLFPV